MVPNPFAAPWLAFLSLIWHNLFPWGVVGAEWAEPASGCNQVVLIHFLGEPGMIAAVGRGIHMDFGKK